MNVSKARMVMKEVVLGIQWGPDAIMAGDPVIGDNTINTGVLEDRKGLIGKGLIDSKDGEEVKRMVLIGSINTLVLFKDKEINILHWDIVINKTTVRSKLKRRNLKLSSPLGEFGKSETIPKEINLLGYILKGTEDKIELRNYSSVAECKFFKEIPINSLYVTYHIDAHMTYLMTGGEYYYTACYFIDKNGKTYRIMKQQGDSLDSFLDDGLVIVEDMKGYQYVLDSAKGGIRYKTKGKLAVKTLRMITQKEYDVSGVVILRQWGKKVELVSLEDRTKRIEIGLIDNLDDILMLEYDCNTLYIPMNNGNQLVVPCEIEYTDYMLRPYSTYSKFEQRMW